MAALAEKQKSISMYWTATHDDLFIREILMFEPWKFKKGSPERGYCWKKIAESLNQIVDPSFRVDDRSVRDRFKLLEKKFIKKKNAMDRASGIAPGEESEMEKGLGEIIELFKDSDLSNHLEKEKQRAAMETEVLQAEELRLQSLETRGETSKKKGSDKEETKPKRRRSDDTINYLREKSEKEMEVREQELQLKKAELEERKADSERLYQVIMQQNNQNQALMAQQQQINLALLQFLTKHNEKK